MPGVCNALCLAKSHLPVLRLLLTNDCSPMDPNVYCCQTTLVQNAVQQEDRALLKLLLKESVVKVNDSEITTCMHMAIESGNIFMVKHLVDWGADINCSMKVGLFHFTPLMLVIGRFSDLHMSELLVKWGSDVNTCSSCKIHDGEEKFSSALHLAVKHDLAGKMSHPGMCLGVATRRNNIVKYLVEDCGTDVNVGQGTVIRHILTNRNATLLQYILENGYNPCSDDG